MQRRSFIAMLGAAVLVPCLAARAQTAQRRRLGLLIGRAEGDAEGRAYREALTEGLAQLGWTLGQNLEYVARWLPRDAEQAQAFAREVMAARPDLLVVNSTPYVRAARAGGLEVPPALFAGADWLAE